MNTQNRQYGGQQTEANRNHNKFASYVSQLNFKIKVYLFFALK